MKNKEKWAKEIVEIAIAESAVALKEGVPIRCEDINCRECGRYVSGSCCYEAWKKWAEAEYKEPKIQPEVKQCKVDDPVLVSGDGENWNKRHFAKYEEERDLVFTWAYGRTSFSGKGIYRWKYAKLPGKKEG